MEAHAADLDHALADAAVAASFEARIRDLEDEQLSPLATRSYPPDRAREEPPCRLRTPFQRDRDRIVHSKSFRRLKHKTQVFVDPEGDHYRTRLTHTLEACGISRTVARALRLNEDLTEAIGLGPRPRPSGLRARGRGGARPRAARALRAALPPQRALAARRRRAGARRRRGSTSPSRCATASCATRARTCRPRSRAASCGSSTASPTSTTTSTTRCAPACWRRTTCRREEIAILGETGSERIDLLVHDLVEASERAGDIAQGERGGRRDGAAAQVHVRQRLLRRGRAPRAGARDARWCRRCSTTTSPHPESCRCSQRTPATTSRRASPTTSPA